MRHRHIAGAVAGVLTAAATMATVVTTAGTAGAAPAWSAVKPLANLTMAQYAPSLPTTATSPTGVTWVYGLYSNTPALMPVHRDGTLSTYDPLPFSYPFAGSGPVTPKTMGQLHFLPDGRPVVSWLDSAGFWNLAVRDDTDQTWGSAMTVPGTGYQASLVTFATAAGKVMGIWNSSGALTEYDYSVDPTTNKLTSTNSPTAPFWHSSVYGGPKTWAVMDASGTADVFDANDPNASIADVKRAADGTWTAGSVASSAYPGIPTGAVAGSRAIVAWHVGGGTEEREYGMVRSAGGGVAVSLLADDKVTSPASIGSSQILAAAGGDGTLAALFEVSQACRGVANKDVVYVTTPTGGLGGGITLDRDGCTNYNSAVPLALGAGGGKAVADVSNEVTASAPSGGYHATVWSGVQVTGSAVHALVEQTMDYSYPPPSYGVYATSIDPQGNVLALGPLTPKILSSPSLVTTEYATYWNPTTAPNPEPPFTTGVPTSSPAPTTTAPAPTTTAPAPTTTAPAPTTTAPAPTTTAPAPTTTAPAPTTTVPAPTTQPVTQPTVEPTTQAPVQPAPTTTAVDVKTGKGGATTGSTLPVAPAVGIKVKAVLPAGKSKTVGLSVTVTAPRGGAVHDAYRVKISLQLLEKVQLKGKKTRIVTVTLASRTVSVTPGKSTTFVFALSAGAQRTLRAHPHDATVLSLVTSRSGFRARTATLTVHVKLPAVKKS